MFLRRYTLGLGFGVTVGVALFLSCTSSPKYDEAKSRKQIRQIVPYTVHVRRTLTLGADPNVGPGGPDYRTEPLPNEKYECEPYSSIYNGLSLENIRACAEALKNPVSVDYRIVRAPAPYFELQVDEITPQCLKDVLPRIPLPREIIFESNESGAISCYSSRLDIEADELLWVKVPKAKTVLTLSFPSILMDTQSEDDFRRLLLSWMMAPFYAEGNGLLQARVVPDIFCRRCMGEKTMTREDKAPLVLWP